MNRCLYVPTQVSQAVIACTLIGLGVIGGVLCQIVEYRLMSWQELRKLQTRKRNTMRAKVSLN